MSLVRVDVDAIEVTILDITASVACDQLTRHIGNGPREKKSGACGPPHCTRMPRHTNPEKLPLYFPDY